MKNVIEKFRDFFKKLPVDQQKDLWEILSALRGPDHDNDASACEVKSFTTCRIRGELLKFNLDDDDVIDPTSRWGALFANNANEIKDCSLSLNAPPLDTKEKVQLFYDFPSIHFRHHIVAAIRAIRELQPETSKDLESFAEYEKPEILNGRKIQD